MRKFGVALFCGVAVGGNLDSDVQRQKTIPPPVAGLDYPPPLDAERYDAEWDIPNAVVGNVWADFPNGRDPDEKEVPTPQHQWMCGNDAQRDKDHAGTAVQGNNALSTTSSQAAINEHAGIQLLRGPKRHGSLEWLKETDKEHLLEADRDSLWFRKSWSDLFCSDYVGGYLNPRAGAENARGVCIRDRRPGHRWMSVVQADNEAKEMWEYFGNVKGSITVPLEAQHGGYQKASEMFKPSSNMSWNYRWGSGGWGNLPPNWCGNYMKQFVCHVAFPQYAGSAPTNYQEWIAGNTEPVGAQERLVRPVCESFGKTIMHACNRAEPVFDYAKKGAKAVRWPWLQKEYTGTGYFAGMRHQDLTGIIDKDEDLLEDERTFVETNKFWITVFNRGFGLAASGTGIGIGEDEEVVGPEYSKRFCATWEAASTSMPALALVVIASILSMLTL